jgi:hypothetical protein
MFLPTVISVLFALNDTGRNVPRWRELATRIDSNGMYSAIDNRLCETKTVGRLSMVCDGDGGVARIQYSVADTSLSHYDQ